MNYVQQKEYTCGVAAVKTLLDNLGLKDLDPQSKIEDKLNTTKDFGTGINEILLYLGSKNILLTAVPTTPTTPTTNQKGICLVNVNIYNNEFPEDKQNGHWLYIELTGETLKAFDPYTGKTTNYNYNDFKKYTKNIKIKNKLFNDCFLFIR